MPSPEDKDTGGGRVPQNGNGHGRMDIEGHLHHDHPHLHEGDDDQEDQPKNGRQRPRKRKLYGDICKQMEFYFSDANIMKNRMMREVVEQANENTEGFVDLSVFLDFTKIQMLSATVTHIKKALVTSEKFELSLDGQKVRRKIPFDPSKTKSEEQVEECTIYVENIPRDSDHEWVEKIFLAFGPVAYVSLPKFKSGQHKGFGFVEFDDNDAARRCVEAYGDEGGCLPSNIDPAQFRSIKSFQEEQEQAQRKIKKSPIGQSPSSEAKEKSCTTQEGTGQKRKAGETLKEDENEPKNKKVKKLSSALPSSSSEAEPEAAEGEDTKSKKRKRKKNKAKKSGEAKLESESIMLKVLPKKSWRQLRNRYLNLQRSNMSKLKKQLQQQYLRAEHTKNFYHPPSSEERHHGNGSHNTIQNIKKEVKDVPVEEPMVYDPILEIKLKDPAESTDSFRNKINIDLAEQTEDEAMISGFIKFVDYKENELHAYVRINGDESFSSRANNLLSRAQDAFKFARFLSAKEATDYKKNVQAALKQKQKEQPRKNVRGKDRLMKAATKSTHIRFDEGTGGSDDDFDMKEAGGKKKKIDTAENVTA